MANLVLPCQDIASGIRMDLIFSFSVYEQQAIGRAQTIRVGDTDVRYASREDLVVLKLVSGRPRDLEDARSVILKNPDMNMAIVERTLGKAFAQGRRRQFDSAPPPRNAPQRKFGAFLHFRVLQNACSPCGTLLLIALFPVEVAVEVVLAPIGLAALLMHAVLHLFGAPIGILQGDYPAGP